MNELEMAKMVEEYDAKEIAQIFGSTEDPVKPMPYFVESIGQFGEAGPQDYVYYYQSAAGTYSIYTVTSTGAITQTEVTPSSPSALSFVSIQSPKYVMRLIELSRAKEMTLAKYKKYMQTAMDMKECHYVRTLLDTAATAQSNTFTNDSSDTKLTFPKIIDCIEAVEDYGNTIKMIAGATPFKNLRTLDYDANKYTSVKAAFEDLNMEVIPVKLKGAARTYGLDDDNSGGLVSTDIVPAGYAYFVATDTAVGNPILVVRKVVSAAEEFSSMNAMPGDRPHRYTFVSPSPYVTLSSSNEVLGVDTISFGEWTAACVCPQAISRVVIS